MTRSNLSLNLSEEIIKVEDAKKSWTNVARGKGSFGGSLVPHDNVDLFQDIFGVYYDDNGEAHNIQRFTWRNRNKIHVQVINYGARITSIKMPDRKGSVDDIVLGFDDIAGYIYNKNKYFGATIGRNTNIVKNCTFHIGSKQHFLSSNYGGHHFNGGRLGFDQVVWTTFVDDKRVIMSHVSPHLHEGYPGDLLVRIIFELSTRNEFSIRMEAQCTQPTIVNISNLTYFNLAGHHAGYNEVYKHVVTLNCNCFTQQTDDLPNGNIMNVVHSEFDFQIPKVLGKVMGIVPKDGYNQNLCVNKGKSQEDCFVARVLHPASGRMLELYSNQWGVNFSTANDFGYGNLMSTEQLLSAPPPTAVRKCEGAEALLRLYEKVHLEMQRTTPVDEAHIFNEVYDLIKKIKEFDTMDPPNTPAEPIDESALDDFSQKKKCLLPESFVFTKLQVEYLNNILQVLCDSCDEDACEELKEILKLIISLAKIKENEDAVETQDENIPEEKKSSNEETQRKKSQNGGSVKVKKKKNSFPEYYTSTSKIIGKDRAHYKTHGGIALQTQNYPACANLKTFPNCILKPGETYTHTITYKFWIRAGNPNKWIKRNMTENRNI